MIFLLQGFFFERHVGLDIGYHGLRGAIPIVREGIERCWFTGVIWAFNDGLTQAEQGEIRDDYGKALVSDVQLSDHSLVFRKRYKHRKDSIDYSFEKDGDTEWIGRYKGKATGVGTARCILTPVADRFFQPPPPISG